MGIGSSLVCASAALLLVGCPAPKRPVTPQQPDQPKTPPSTTPSASDNATMKVHLIDVGAGASTLIEFSCAAILIDTGGESNASFDSTASLKAYLDAFFAKRTDLNNTLALLITTHNHIDHLRGAEAVFGGYKVQNVVTNGRTDSSGGGEQKALIGAATAAGIGLRAIDAKAVPAGGLTDAVIDPVKCADGDPDIRVLWGSVDKADVTWTAAEYKNANNHSVATRVALGKSSILITGDLEEDGIAALLKQHAGSNVLDSDVYQVGHHGSHNATTKPLLDAITPKLALIGVGPADDRQVAWTSWAYGHPRRVVIEKLEAALASEKPRTASVRQVGTGAKKFEDRSITAPIYTTAWDGAVVVTMYGDGRAADVTVSK